MDDTLEFLHRSFPNGEIVLDFIDEIITDGKKVEMFFDMDKAGLITEDEATLALYILIMFKGYFTNDNGRCKITIYDTKGFKFYTAKEVIKDV